MCVTASLGGGRWEGGGRGGGGEQDVEDAAAYGWDMRVEGLDWGRFMANKNKEIRRLNGVRAAGGGGGRMERLETSAGVVSGVV